MTWKMNELKKNINQKDKTILGNTIDPGNRVENISYETISRKFNGFALNRFALWLAKKNE